MFATQSLISGMIFVVNGLKANIYLILNLFLFPDQFFY